MIDYESLLIWGENDILPTIAQKKEKKEKSCSIISNTFHINK